MKLSSSLLQAITLGVSVTAITAITTSCEKQKITQTKERTKSGQTVPTGCPACGMG